ncbi:uncharacterized protein [Cherax quadricarinatus]|uniref:uncharacterized protein n=1 Tax=Cherax quadricarinatus TaxID=27406 RepID=UPI00387EA8D0
MSDVADPPDLLVDLQEPLEALKSTVTVKKDERRKVASILPNAPINKAETSTNSTLFTAGGQRSGQERTLRRRDSKHSLYSAQDFREENPLVRVSSFFGSRHFPELFGRSAHNLGGYDEPSNDHKLREKKKNQEDIQERKKAKKGGNLLEEKNEATLSRNTDGATRPLWEDDASKDKVTSATSGSLKWEHLTSAVFGSQVEPGEHPSLDISHHWMPTDMVNADLSGAPPEFKPKHKQTAININYEHKNGEAESKELKERSNSSLNDKSDDQSLQKDCIHFEDLEHGTRKKIKFSDEFEAIHSADADNPFVKTGWSTFRTDAIKAISELGSRIMRPPSSDVMYMTPLPETCITASSPANPSAPQEQDTAPLKLIPNLGSWKPHSNTRVDRLDKSESLAEVWRQPRRLWLKRSRGNQQVLLLDFKTTKGEDDAASKSVSTQHNLVQRISYNLFAKLRPYSLAWPTSTNGSCPPVSAAPHLSPVYECLPSFLVFRFIKTKTRMYTCTDIDEESHGCILAQTQTKTEKDIRRNKD